MENLVTIKSATFVNDLSVAISYLEENGIRCSLRDAYGAAVFSAVTEAELQVMQKDVKRAIELLIEGGFATADDYK